MISAGGSLTLQGYYTWLINTFFGNLDKYFTSWHNQMHVMTISVFLLFSLVIFIPTPTFSPSPLFLPTLGREETLSPKVFLFVSITTLGTFIEFWWKNLDQNHVSPMQIIYSIVVLLLTMRNHNIDTSFVRTSRRDL